VCPRVTMCPARLVHHVAQSTECLVQPHRPTHGAAYRFPCRHMRKHISLTRLISMHPALPSAPKQRRDNCYGGSLPLCHSPQPDHGQQPALMARQLVHYDDIPITAKPGCQSGCRPKQHLPNANIYLDNTHSATERSAATHGPICCYTRF
jgi:hypothetical protein